MALGDSEALRRRPGESAVKSSATASLYREACGSRGIVKCYQNCRTLPSRKLPYSAYRPSAGPASGAGAGTCASQASRMGRQTCARGARKGRCGRRIVPPGPAQRLARTMAGCGRKPSPDEGVRHLPKPSCSTRSAQMAPQRPKRGAATRIVQFPVGQRETSLP